MKKPRTTARSLVLAARALARASKELERAARLHEKDLVDIYARLLTPGGSRLDHETRVAQVQRDLEIVPSTTEPTNLNAERLRSALTTLWTSRSTERE